MPPAPKASAKKYIEKEAEHSGSSEGSSSEDEYSGSFIASDSSGEDDTMDIRAKQMKEEAEKDAADAMAQMESLRKRKAEPKQAESKQAESKHKQAAPEDKLEPDPKKKKIERQIPAELKEPAKTVVVEELPDFHYEIIFTNARFAQNFWGVPCKALPYMFFHIDMRADYSGLRLEAHDNPPTMAIKSCMECIIHEGVGTDGKKLKRTDLDKEFFCVNSKNLRNAFKCTQLKDAPLRLVKYHNKDGIVFESMTNEHDVQTQFVLPFYSKIPSNVLQQLSSVSEVQIEMATNVLQKMGAVASTVDAATMRFELFSGKSSDPSISRNKLRVWFPGSEIPGNYTFWLNRKKRVVDGVDEFEAVAANSTEDKKIEWTRVSSNSYNSSKFKLFVSNLENQMCFLNLSSDDKPKPIVIVADSAEAGANRTSHTIFVSPQEDDDD